MTQVVREVLCIILVLLGLGMALMGLLVLLSALMALSQLLRLWSADLFGNLVCFLTEKWKRYRTWKGKQ
jgi:hypothetical protein